jgi:hypothetical protein
VLPISYRLIVFDTALLVKKSLNILNQNGEPSRHDIQMQELIRARRHRLSAAVGLQIVHLCRITYDLGLHKRHPVLLAESGRPRQGRPVPLEQPARYVT